MGGGGRMRIATLLGVAAVAVAMLALLVVAPPA
jgi:hypothetical protein